MHPYREPFKSEMAFARSLTPSLFFVLLLLLASFLATATHCGPGSVTQPPQGPGTGFPCGYHGHSCGNGYCCDDNEECGTDPDAGFSACPPNMCCYTGEDATSLTAKRGGHRPQFKQVQGTDSGS
jgi:hypothetical protein